MKQSLVLFLFIALVAGCSKEDGIRHVHPSLAEYDVQVLDYGSIQADESLYDWFTFSREALFETRGYRAKPMEGRTYVMVSSGSKGSGLHEVEVESIGKEEDAMVFRVLDISPKAEAPAVEETPITVVSLEGGTYEEIRLEWYEE